MLIKFFSNGKGAGAGPVDYLVAREVLAYDSNRDLIRDAGSQVAQDLGLGPGRHRQHHGVELLAFARVQVQLVMGAHAGNALYRHAGVDP